MSCVCKRANERVTFWADRYMNPRVTSARKGLCGVTRATRDSRSDRLESFLSRSVVSRRLTVGEHRAHDRGRRPRGMPRVSRAAAPRERPDALNDHAPPHARVDASRLCRASANQKSDQVLRPSCFPTEPLPRAGGFRHGFRERVRQPPRLSGPGWCP